MMFQKIAGIGGTAALLALALAAALLLRPLPQETGTVQVVSEWELSGSMVALPYRVKNLSPRTPLILSAELECAAGDCLYLKTVYMPLRVYADDTLLFTYGQEGDYPSFLLDPPTKPAIIPLPAGGGTFLLRLEFLSPSQRGSAALSPALVGASEDILLRLFSEMGFSLCFSVILLALAPLLMLIALVVTRFEKKGMAFFWLGLFAACVGGWSFGECNLTGVLLNAPEALYLAAFLGFFALPLPLLRAGLVILNLHAPSDAIIRCFCAASKASLCAALLLQLGGIAAFSKTMYFFHVLIPLSLCAFVAVLLFEGLHFRNHTAKQFFLPAAMIALFALLELANYYIFHFDVQKSTFFQFGVLVFTGMVSVICGYAVRDAFLLRARNRELSFAVSMMEKQMEMQKSRYRLLSENAAQVRQQHHDLKHHLAAIQGGLLRGETGQVLAYLENLIAALPSQAPETLCANGMVNALALYYKALAEKRGVRCTILLDIPQDTGGIPENDLCVIVGNLLENAVAACANAENPFIRLQSRCEYGILTVTMDNSYTWLERAEDGGFRSAKPSGGMGLRSVASLAEKYGGGSRFEARDGVFSSSAYLRLQC